MINFLRIANNIKLGNLLHSNGFIDDVASDDVIGICVIPSNFLPDKLARFTSINSIAGPWSNKINLVDNYKTDLPGLDKRKQCVFGFIKNDGNPSTIASPFLPGTSEFNPDFFRETPGGNAFQDYKGYENTKIYREKHKKLNKYVNAFNLCSKISPSYRNRDWYLPALGELAFLAIESKALFRICTTSFVGKSEIDRFIFGCHWSSTELSKEAVWDIGMRYGSVGYYCKNGKDIIRAFLTL